MQAGPDLDPREVLGLGAAPSADEVVRAYRRLAQRWHPDHASDRDAPDRMALINAAYEALREAPAPATDGRRDATDRPAPGAVPRTGPLGPALRRALGAELRRALEAGETVEVVVPAATWQSPQTTLAVTDRRLLWLLDDAPVNRVRTLEYRDVREVAVKPVRPWRTRAQLVVRDRRGHRTAFAELAQPTAEALAGRTRRHVHPTLRPSRD